MAEVDKPDDQFDDAKGNPKAAKLGDRYEIAILTHVAICCAKDKTVKDFAITFNAKDHGNLDDIIVRQDKLLTFIQIKHKAGKCNIIPEYGNYECTYENILLPKYKKQIERGFKLKIIFLCNANVLIPKNMKKLPIDEKNEKFFTGKGEVFQNAHQNGASDTEEFYKNLYIFSKQSAYSQYKDMLLNDLNRTVEIDQIKALYDYFEDAVVGRTEPFTKKEILKVLNLFILKPAMLFNDAKILTLNKYLTLFKNLLSFKLIVVTEKYKNLMLDIITQNVLDNLEFNTAVNCKEEIPQSLLDKVNENKDVGILLKRNKWPYIFEHLFVALWQIGQIPIALNYSEFKKQIDFSMSHFVAEDDGPVTLIVNDLSQAPPTNFSILRDLTSFDEATRKEFMQQINIKIGKSTWKLDEFIGEDISTINKITTDVLIFLLCNFFDVDKIAEEAPIYVPRKVKIKLLKKDVLTTSNFLFVIDNDESQLDFRTYLGDQEKYSNKNVINSKLSLFETKEKMKLINPDYCLLRQFEDNYMLYGYKGPLSNLEEYFQEEELPENKIMDNLSMVNIIAADAGMGKTYLLKNAMSYLFDMKLLPIYLNLGDTCEELNNLPQDLTSLTDYLADKFTGNYDKTIDSQTLDFFKSALKHNTEERKIVLLLDGFDEAPLDFRVIDFFSSLHIKVIITTRMHRLQPILEHCQCLAFTLMTFTSQDQKDLFKFHYGNVEDEKVDKIIEILNKNIESSLMTIPLQTKHVVEIFTDINKLFEDIDNINVLFLYEKFIEKHLNTFAKGRSMYETLIEKSACVLLMDSQFSEEFLLIDESEWNKHISEFTTENEKNFIITGFKNDTPQFIHRTYAEFLCAKYLTKKKSLSSSVIDRLLKEENLLKVRHFFDIIISNSKFRTPFSNTMK